MKTVWASHPSSSFQNVNVVPQSITRDGRGVPHASLPGTLNAWEQPLSSVWLAGPCATECKSVYSNVAHSHAYHCVDSTDNMSGEAVFLTELPKSPTIISTSWVQSKLKQNILLELLLDSKCWIFSERDSSHKKFCHTWIHWFGLWVQVSVKRLHCQSSHVQVL